MLPFAIANFHAGKTRAPVNPSTFAVLGLLPATVVTPVQAAGFIGFVHSDNNGDAARCGTARPAALVSQSIYMLAGTGIAGELSTFSSFAYAVAALTIASMASALVASAYVVISLVLGCIAIIVGLKLGRQRVG